MKIILAAKHASEAGGSGEGASCVWGMAAYLMCCLTAKRARLVVRYGNAQEGTGAHKFLHEAIEVEIVGGFDGKADNRAVLFYILGHVDVALHEACGCNLLLNAVDVGIYSRIDKREVFCFFCGKTNVLNSSERKEQDDAERERGTRKEKLRTPAGNAERRGCPNNRCRC